MKLRIETGVVKFFDGRDNKRFGFIVLESGEEIFFHYNDGRAPFVSRNALNWDFPNVNARTALDYPLAGNRLYFERAKGSNGRPKASPWTSQEHYEKEALICSCDHHISEHHFGSNCGKCDCLYFGEPAQNWE